MDSITKYLPKYQDTLKNLMKEGYELVGYSRKSPGSENNDTITRLVQYMANKLKGRLFVKRIYVSPASRPSTPFSERDIRSNNAVMYKLKNMNEDCQDKFKYVQEIYPNSTSKKYAHLIDYRHTGIL